MQSDPAFTCVYLAVGSRERPGGQCARSHGNRTGRYQDQGGIAHMSLDPLPCLKQANVAFVKWKEVLPIKNIFSGLEGVLGNFGRGLGQIILQITQVWTPDQKVTPTGVQNGP